ncbi:hypothetical protein ALP90_03515 [Pseudomonas amygdali pv. ulmi]|uniref:Uncharacterized protein n=1 Tax=Pseudomonas amygdali pv. ulmi TaxID=251720 RepID=A0A3M4SQB8_PSEA0|nr:hypothetical protein ALP90_03515 [Pseudomonas amygdali pv. ulmi]
MSSLENTCTFLPGTKKTHRSYVWAYASSQFSDVAAVVYDFSPSRAGAFLAFDQISRPYYPQLGEDESTIGENEEVSAMRRHIDFLFKETAAQEGLQVLLIEHAFFGDDPRYVAATRKRWNKLSEDALIPRDWPKRPDTQ